MFEASVDQLFCENLFKIDLRKDFNVKLCGLLMNFRIFFAKHKQIAISSHMNVKI